MSIATTDSNNCIGSNSLHNFTQRSVVPGGIWNNGVGRLVLLCMLVLCGAGARGQAVPEVWLRAGGLRARIALPDAQRGFYRTTRFDWSGIVTSLQYRHHEFITPWYQEVDPALTDFQFRDGKVIVGPCCAMVGMPEEFLSLPDKSTFGWSEAPVGGTFVKIGVGVLRKPDAQPYDHFRAYPLVDGGRWTVRRTGSRISFTQTVNDPGSGYGYVYTKTIRLASERAEMTIAHTLRNTGRKPIVGEVYDHNFTLWDGARPDPGYQVLFPFRASTPAAAEAQPLQLDGSRARFHRALGEQDRVRIVPQGFGPTPADYDFRIENSKLRLGLRIRADQPLAHFTLWAIQPVFAVEPFISLDIAPGQEKQWTLRYDAYTPAQKQ